MTSSDSIKIQRSYVYRHRGKHVSAVDFSRQLTHLKKTATYDWLSEASATCLTQKLRDQDTAFRNFFAGRAKYPRFKKRTHAQSIRYQLDQRQAAGMYRAGEFLKLPKLGALKLKWSRTPGGIPKMVTVTKDCTGRYFISFMCEETIQSLPQKPNGIGMDLGVKDIVVTSEGWKSGNPRHLRRYARQPSAGSLASVKAASVGTASGDGWLALMRRSETPAKISCISSQLSLSAKPV